jgi:hypothetical protein
MGKWKSGKVDFFGKNHPREKKHSIWERLKLMKWVRAKNHILNKQKNDKEDVTE